MGKLTTHVLDTALGRPGSDMLIELFSLQNAEPQLLSHFRTNNDGRVATALLEGVALQVGSYELNFFAGDYLRQHHQGLAEPLFLDIITVRFGIAHADEHYHVPLLLSPFAYSTYRGS